MLYSIGLFFFQSECQWKCKHFTGKVKLPLWNGLSSARLVCHNFLKGVGRLALVLLSEHSFIDPKLDYPNFLWNIISLIHILQNIFLVGLRVLLVLTFSFQVKTGPRRKTEGKKRIDLLILISKSSFLYKNLVIDVKVNKKMIYVQSNPPTKWFRKLYNDIR